MWAVRWAVGRALRSRKKSWWWLFLVPPVVGMSGLVLLVAALVGTSQASCAPSNTPVSFQSSNPATMATLVRYFESAGWMPNAAAGIVGNMAQEDSTFDPAAAGGGLVQNIGAMWSAQVSYDQRQSPPLDPNSYDGQLEFLVWYVPQQSWWAQFSGASTPQDAALWFQNGYEQCSGAGQSGTDQVGGGLCNPANRQAQAAAALAAAGGSTVSVSLTANSCSAVSVGGYMNPLAHLQGIRGERVDMGVDYSGTGEIDAIGAGTIVNTAAHGWPGTAFIEEQLTMGAYAGKFWFAAECIISTVQTGQTVQAGQQIGTVTNCGSGIEVGWSVGQGGTTLAASLHEQSPGDPGGWTSAAGASASRLLQSLGAPPGVMQAGGPHGTLPAGYP